MRYAVPSGLYKLNPIVHFISGVMQGICEVSRGLIVPNPLHCGQYYNCTRGAGPYLFECPYPELFDVSLKLCRLFQAVHCGARHEFAAPCEYFSFSLEVVMFIEMLCSQERPHSPNIKEKSCGTFSVIAQ